MGLLGTGLLLASLLLLFGKTLPLVSLLDIVCTWAAFLLFLYAGLRGSKWWLVGPVLFFALYAWVLTQGH